MHRHQAIVAEGLKNVTAGASPMDIKRGIDKAVAKVVESRFEDRQEIFQIRNLLVVDQNVRFLHLTFHLFRILLVIAEDVDSEALTTLVVNRLRSQLKICAVKAPEISRQITAVELHTFYYTDSSVSTFSFFDSDYTVRLSSNRLFRQVVLCWLSQKMWIAKR